MRLQRLIVVLLASALTTTVVFGQIGRTGTQWLTALATPSGRHGSPPTTESRSQAMSKPGFDLQWKTKLDNPPRGVYGPGQGVTATGVTIFVPMSLVTGSSNTIYGVDNDLGYVVWKRQFEELSRPRRRLSRRDLRRRDPHRPAQRYRGDPAAAPTPVEDLSAIAVC